MEGDDQAAAVQLAEFLGGVPYTRPYKRRDSRFERDFRALGGPGVDAERVLEDVVRNVFPEREGLLLERD